LNGALISPDPEFPLSGPTLAATANYSGVAFYFLGDQHFSTEYSCEGPCTTFDGKELKNPDAICQSATGWIYRLAQSSKDYTVDVYLEAPLPYPGSVRPSGERWEKYRAELGILVDVEEAFRDPAYRVHHLDTRIEYTPTGGRNITIEDAVVDYLLMAGRKGMPPRDVRTIIRLLYGKSSLVMGLYRLMLDSDHYTEEVSELFHPLLKKMTKPTSWQALKRGILQNSWVSQIGDKVQHRVRKQLYRLEQEGRSKLAQQIRDWSWKRFESLPIETPIKAASRAIWKHSVGALPEADKDKAVEQLKGYIRKLVVLRQSILMDAYALARMLRNWPGADRPPSAKRIVFTGAAHSLEYIRFFQEELKVTVNVYRSAGGKSLRCVMVPTRLFS